MSEEDDIEYFGDPDEGYDDGDYDDDADYDDDIYEMEEAKEDADKDIFLACQNNLYLTQDDKDIIARYKKAIHDVAHENGISEGRAFLVLQANRYDISKSENIPSNLIDTIFYQDSKEMATCKNTKECLLCFDDLNPNSKYSLDCQHNFCKDSCFKQYMYACLAEGSSILLKTCPMDGCKERLGIKEADIFFTQERERNLYSKFLLNDILSHTTKIVQCPHTECNLILDFQNSKIKEGLQLNLKCKCDYAYFCSLCKEDAHLPCTCEMLHQWKDLIQGKNSEDMNQIWLKLNTKPCPRCKVVIEKNKGCMHMNCKNCNYHFCWLCMGEYINHDDFYSCNKYKKEEGNPLGSEQEKLKKYDFYTDRFKDHLGAARLTQIESKQHIQQLRTALKNSEIEAGKHDGEMEFYVHGYGILIESKKCIAYTYPIGYYIEDHKRQYFEFLQGELEKNLNPYEELLNQADFQEQFDVSTGYKSFYEYRQLVLKQTQKIMSYLWKMVKSLGDKLPELDLKKQKSLSKKMSKLLRNQSKAQQKILEKPHKSDTHQVQAESHQFQMENEVLMCIECRINPANNEYGVCDGCFSIRFEEDQ